LGLTPAAYGAASSIFYASYIVGLVTFSLVTPKTKARHVLACLLCAWGAVAACTALVKNASQLYALRVLLGACESGALPAMQAHILRFFPRTRWV
jgi:MFS family permease